MYKCTSGKSIVVIERRHRLWLEDITQMLKNNGHSVCSLRSYALDSIEQCFSGNQVDLVLLSCGILGPEEEKLIRILLSRQLPLVVLCVMLSMHDTRRLFRAGVKDIAERPSQPTHVVEFVEQALVSIAQIDSYHKVQLLERI